MFVTLTFLTSRQEAYLKQGDGGQKVSIPKQLAVALMEKSITNTTVLLIKPNFCAPYQSEICPSINGITILCSKVYHNCFKQQKIHFYNCLGQKIPSLSVPVPSCHASSLITSMGEDGINFTGVMVLLYSDSNDAYRKVRMVKKWYTKRAMCISNK